MEFDKRLIEQSLTAQYGILPERQNALPYRDWAALVAGLMPESLFGRVVSVRSEQDVEVIAGMNPWQKRIRKEWQRFCGERKQPQQIFGELEALQQAMKQMYGAKG